MVGNGKWLFILNLVFFLNALTSSCVNERLDSSNGDIFIIAVFPAANISLPEFNKDQLFGDVLHGFINKTNEQNEISKTDSKIGHVFHFLRPECSAEKMLNIVFKSNFSNATMENTIAVFVSEDILGSKQRDENSNLPIFILTEDPNPNHFAFNTHPIAPRIFLEIKLFNHMLTNSNIPIVDLVSTSQLFDQIIETRMMPSLLRNKTCFRFMKSSFVSNRIVEKKSYVFLFGDNKYKIKKVLKQYEGSNTNFIGHSTWTDSLGTENIMNTTENIRIVQPWKMQSEISSHVLKMFEVKLQNGSLIEREQAYSFLTAINFVMDTIKWPENGTNTNKSLYFETILQARALINKNYTSIFPSKLSFITLNGSEPQSMFYTVDGGLVTKLQTNVQSKCSQQVCQFNFQSVYYSTNVTKNITSFGYSCKKCSTSDHNQNPSCRRHYEQVSYRTSLAYVVYAIMALGVVTSATVCIIFFVFKNTPYVKASHQSMSLVQLFAHLLLFLAPAMFIGRPSQTLCAIRPITFGILFTFIMAMIVTKTQKLNFIFHSRLRVSKRQIQMSQKLEISLVLLMMTIQFGIAVLSFFMSPSRVLIIYRKELKSYVIKCNTDEEFVIQLIFGLLLAFMCMIQAYKARKLPENFNETKLIFIAMTLCIISAIIGLLLRDYAKKSSEKALVDVLLLLSMNSVLLFIMYGHKCYIIIFRPQLNTPTAFKQNIQLHNLRGMVPDHVTMSHRDSTVSTTITTPPHSRNAVFSAQNLAYKS